MCLHLFFFRVFFVFSYFAAKQNMKMFIHFMPKCQNIEMNILGELKVEFHWKVAFAFKFYATFGLLRVHLMTNIYKCVNVLNTKTMDINEFIFLFISYLKSCFYLCKNTRKKPPKKFVWTRHKRILRTSSDKIIISL